MSTAPRWIAAQSGICAAASRGHATSTAISAIASRIHLAGIDVTVNHPSQEFKVMTRRRLVALFVTLLF
jgi:hypothetical protein